MLIYICIKSHWLDVSWFISCFCAIFNNLSTWDSRRHGSSDSADKLTRMFKDGSAAARRPAVIHAAVPPNSNQALNDKRWSVALPPAKMMSKLSSGGVAMVMLIEPFDSSING